MHIGLPFACEIAPRSESLKGSGTAPRCRFHRTGSVSRPPPTVAPTLLFRRDWSSDPKPLTLADPMNDPPIRDGGGGDVEQELRPRRGIIRKLPARIVSCNNLDQPCTRSVFLACRATSAAQPEGTVTQGSVAGSRLLLWSAARMTIQRATRQDASGRLLLFSSAPSALPS
jgi:hypothetical protein